MAARRFLPAKSIPSLPGSTRECKTIKYHQSFIIMKSSMKFAISAVICLALIRPPAAYCQLYSTRAGFVGFYSKTALEDVKGENNQVYAIIDAGKKNLAFA